MKTYNNFDELYSSNTQHNLSIFNEINVDNDEEYEAFTDFESAVKEEFDYRVDELLDDIIADVGERYGIYFEDGENTWTSVTISTDLDFDASNFVYKG